MKNISQYLKTSKVPTAIENMVKKVNEEIKKANSDDVYAIEPDSTWETGYEFHPVVIKGNFLYIEHIEISNPKKIIKDRYNLKEIDDVKWQLNWITRAIKKGYREHKKQKNED